MAYLVYTMQYEELIERLKVEQGKTAAEREAHLAGLLKQHPNIDICKDRVPSMDEIEALERCPLLDGILIIFAR